jgi:hypothetical protein
VESSCGSSKELSGSTKFREFPEKVPELVASVEVSSIELVIVEVTHYAVFSSHCAVLSSALCSFHFICHRSKYSPLYPF